MKVTVQKSFLFVLIMLLLAISAYPNSSSTYSGYQLSTTASEISRSPGLDDITGYISVGADVSDDGKVSSENSWRVRLFGPGMFYFYGLIISLFGLNTPLPIIILVLSIVAWSAILFRYVSVLRKHSGVQITTVWLSVIIFCSWFSSGLLTENLLGADNLSFMVFSFAILLTFNSNKTIPAFIPGVLLGLLTLTSARYYAVLLFGSCYFIGLLIVKSTRAILHTHNWSFLNSNVFRRFLLIILCAFLTGMPWRIISSINVGPGEYSIRGSAYYWNQRWMPDQWMIENGLQFLYDGGANSACDIDPTLCNNLYKYEILKGSEYNGAGYSNEQFKDLAINTYKDHPIAFLNNRFQNFVNSWFGLLRNPSPQTRIFQVVSFISFLLCLAKGVSSLFHRRPYDLSVLALIVLTAFVSPFALYHIEYRYLRNVQLFSFAIVPFLYPGFINYCRTKFNKKDNHPT
jgi:hypothetical protein